MSKRQSLAPAAPKPPTTLSATLLISEHVSLTGLWPISIADNCVVHPRAKITSAHAPVSIGRDCIVSERSCLGLAGPARSDDEARQGLVVGNGVVIETGAVVEAKSVGDGCLLEVGSRIGKGAVLGKVRAFIYLCFEAGRDE